MRYLILIISLLIVTVFAFAFWIMPEQLEPTNHSQSQGKALIGGDFSAIDHTGNPFTQDNLKGRYSLIYFGFTHCPDICPTSLLVMANSIDDLGDKAEQILPVFISVDPERDTQDAMAQYVSNFHPRLVGVTGTPEQIKHLAQVYKVYFSKVEQPDSAIDYLVDHSGFIFLMNPQGEYITHFPHNVAQQELTATLRGHIK